MPTTHPQNQQQQQDQLALDSTSLAPSHRCQQSKHLQEIWVKATTSVFFTQILKMLALLLQFDEGMSC